MALIDWDDRLITGQPAMDRDHKRITGLINAMAERVAADPQCRAMLDELVRRTETHFAMEAKLMDRHRYPHAAAHRARHELLMKDLLTFKSWYDAGSTAHIGSALAFLEGWWTRHIADSDKDLARFLGAPRARRARISAPTPPPAA